MEPIKRDCYFKDETDTISTHQVYSQYSCALECSLEYAKRATAMEMNLSTPCAPWYFPSEKDSITVCDPWQSVEFMKHYSAVPGGTCGHCLPGEERRNVRNQNVPNQDVQNQDVVNQDVQNQNVQNQDVVNQDVQNQNVQNQNVQNQNVQNQNVQNQNVQNQNVQNQII
jgi:hypothetical protein